MILWVVVVILLQACKSTGEIGKQPHSASVKDGFHPDLKAVVYYQSSAEVKALYYQGYHLAQIRLEYYLTSNTNQTKKPAVVLDIDETVLDNSPYQAFTVVKRVSYPTGWDEWVQQANADLLPGVKEFLEFAALNEVEIFYISNRKQSGREATITNMNKYGLPYVDEEHLLLRDDSTNKTIRRDQIAQNYDIVLLIGDNLGDFDHLFQEKSTDEREKLVDDYKDWFGTRFIMLPNSMYGEWDGAIFNYQWDMLLDERYKLLESHLKSFDMNRLTNK